MPLRRRELLSAAAIATASVTIPLGESLLSGRRVAFGQTATAPPSVLPQTAPPLPLPPVSASGLLFSCKYGMTKGPSLEARLAAAREAGLDGVDFDDAAGVTPEQLG